MKKIVLFLSVLVTLGSCQKKNYASFQKSTMPTYTSEKKVNITVQPAVEVAKIEDEETEMPVSTQIMASVNENDLSLLFVNTEVSAFEIPQAEEVKRVEKVTFKQTFKNKVKEKVFLKQLNKVSKSSTKPNEGKINTLSLLSLIFGGLGLLLIATGIGGILFGLAGFILGLIALKKKTNNRTMATLGLIFGAVAVLITILAIGLIAGLAIFS